MPDNQSFKDYPARRLPVARFNKQVNLAVSRLLKAANSDLSREQEVILRQLRIRDGISQVALAGLVNQDSNNISRTLSILEKRGLIKRVASETDGRSQNIEITSDGIAAHRRAFTAIEKYWKIVFDGFSPDEVEIFARFMNRMTENLAGFLKGENSQKTD